MSLKFFLPWVLVLVSVLKNKALAIFTYVVCFSKMIETQKHQQSFEALGLFQIDFGLMTLISQMFLSTATH